MVRLVAVFVALTPAVAYANLTEAPRLAAVYDKGPTTQPHR